MGLLLSLLLGLLFGSIQTTLAAIIPVAMPATTSAPVLNLARRGSSSCKLTKAPAMTLDGVTYSASSTCTCGKGVVASAIRTVGQDGSTTWNCAEASTPMPVSTGEPAPTPTWAIQVEVGRQSFMVGDYDYTTGLNAMMNTVCDSRGCDGGDPQTFQFNWTQSTHFALTANGAVTMTGFIDNSDSIQRSLQQSINAVLKSSHNCSQVSTSVPTGDVNDQGVPQFVTMPISQCTIVNHVQATLYNGPHSSTAHEMAQMSFGGSSKDPGLAFCSEIIDDINLALAQVLLPPVVPGVVAIAQAYCAS